jgi:hypothetical protein
MCDEVKRQYRAETLASEAQFCMAEALYEGTPLDCENAKSLCIAGSYYEDELADDPSCAGSPRLSERISGACSATVADLRACIREDAMREGSIGKKYDCQVAGTYIPEWEGMGPDCTAMFNKCPGADL